MFSIKRFRFFHFATFLILRASTFFLFCFFAEELRADESLIRVRESKFYREIAIRGKTILINKKNSDLFLADEGKAIKIHNSKNSKNYTFSIVDKDNTHYLIQLSNPGMKNRIGYHLRQNEVQFEDEICKTQESYKEKFGKLINSELLSKINGFKIEKLFDRVSCGKVGEEVITEFKKALIQALTLKTSQLKRCADSSVAQAFFDKDPVLMQNGLEVFGRYFKLIESLETSKLSFKCGLHGNDKNKVASFSQNPLEVALNVVNDKFNLNIDNIDAVINHELIHYGSQQFKEKPKSRCIDEGIADLFETVCKYRTGAQDPEKSDAVIGRCLKGEENKTVVGAHIGAKGGNDKGLPSLVAAAELENRELARQGTQAVVAAANSGNKPVFEEIPNSTVQLAATAPVMTTSGKPLSSFEGDGEFHTVVADSDFSSSVQRLGQSLANSMTNANQLLTTALSGTAKVAAVAAIGSSAVAASRRTASSSGQYSPMTSSEIFMNRYYPDSKEVQVAMGNPKLDTMTYDQKEEYYRSFGKEPTQYGVSVQLASDKASTPKAADAKVASNVGGKNLKAGGVAAQATAGSSAGRTVASLPTQVDNGSAAPVESEEAEDKPVPQNSGAVRNTQSAVPPNIKLDNAIIQRLTAFNKVNEPAYTRVTERFNDQTFRQQLDARKIRIVGENNKPLWVSSTQPERCFRDNKTTKVLEVVACK